MSETLTTPEAAPAADSKMLSLRGIAEVFYKPTAFFRELVEKPKVLIPYLLIGIIFPFVLFSIRELIWEMVSQSPKFIERTQNAALTPGQLHTIVTYQFMIAGSLFMMLSPLVVAALAFFWGNFVFAGKARFKQVLSIVLYGELLYAIGALVNVPLILAKGNLMASLSLGVLAAGQGMESWAYAILSKISLFFIWEIVVVAIGLSILYNVQKAHGYRLSLLSVGLTTAVGIILGKLVS